MFGQRWTALAVIVLGFEVVSGKHNEQPVFSKTQQRNYYPSHFESHLPVQHPNQPVFSKTTPSSIGIIYEKPYPQPRPPMPKPVTCPAQKIIQCFPNAVLNFARIGMKRVGEIFVNSPDTRELYLDDNEITEISPMAFDKMPRLETLSLSGNNITVDKLLWFSRHDTLQKLVIDDNKRYEADSVLSEVLEPLPRLRQLSLRRSNIFKFQPNLAEFAPQLSELDLSGNRIEDVDFLERLPKSLAKLRLNDNLISNVIADRLKSVAELLVSGNRFEELCGASCSGDRFLSLSGVDQLSRLNASRNRIDAVASDSFRDTRQLLDLDLSENEIRSLPDDVFSGLQLLEQLRINGNRLTSVPSLCSLSRMKHLDLSGNWITQISDKSFCSPMQLETVNLADNRISNVDSNGFLSLHLLRVLDLSSNFIDKLPLTFINNAWKLDTLLLKNNNIVSIDEFLATSKSALQQLHLQGNPLPCFKVSYLPVKIHLNEPRQAKKNGDAIVAVTESSDEVDTSSTTETYE